MNSAKKVMEQAISAYAESIQKTIAEGDWDALNDVLKERQQTLESFFSNQQIEGKSLQLRETIKTIQQQDAVFLSVVEAQKKAMKKQYSSLKQGRESVKAYQQF